MDDGIYLAAKPQNASNDTLRLCLCAERFDGRPLNHDDCNATNEPRHFLDDALHQQ